MLISVQFIFDESLDRTRISVQFAFSESLDLTVGSANLAGMSVRVFAFRKRIENDIRTRSDNE